MSADQGSGDAVNDAADDRRAREEIFHLIADGCAVALMNAWSVHGQSCAHTDSIIDHVAVEGSSMTAQQFARSLQEEASK